jgi:hypothetical protein
MRWLRSWVCGARDKGKSFVAYPTWCLMRFQGLVRDDGQDGLQTYLRPLEWSACAPGHDENPHEREPIALARPLVGHRCYRLLRSSV